MLKSNHQFLVQQQNLLKVASAISIHHSEPHRNKSRSNSRNKKAKNKPEAPVIVEVAQIESPAKHVNEELENFHVMKLQTMKSVKPATMLHKDTFEAEIEQRNLEQEHHLQITDHKMRRSNMRAQAALEHA